MDILKCCVSCYKGGTPGDEPLLSPIAASDALLRRIPMLYLVAVELDPLLDDTIDFARRLKRLGCRFKIHLVQGLPHGFLSFKDLDAKTLAAHDHCLRWAQEALAVSSPEAAAAAGADACAEDLSLS